MTSDFIGPLVYVMGPSGAGKDSVMARARALLPAGSRVAFAHRYITRPAETGGENHVALSPAEFAVRKEAGLLAFHWHAHGYEYGIGQEIQAWRAAGMVVVVSGSRAHFIAADGLDADTHPVLITAPSSRRAERLAARGREDGTAVSARLDRGRAYEVADRRLVTIVNDGALDLAAEAFVNWLATLRCSPGARHRA